MTVENKFGFNIEKEMCKNMNLVFTLDNIEGMTVDYINVHINLRDRKNPTFTRKTLAPIGQSKDGSKKMYSITQDNHAVQIKIGDEKATLRINRGKSEWIDKPNVHNVISDYDKAEHDRVNAPFLNKNRSKG